MRHQDNRSSGDATRDASSRPPQPDGDAGADPDRSTSAPAVGVGTSPSDETVPGWLLHDDLDPAVTNSPRRYLLWGLAVVPWFVVGLLILRPSAPSRSPTPDVVADASPAVAPSVPHTPATDRSPSPAPNGPSPQGAISAESRIEVSGGARTTTTLADATALASVLARDWLGGIGPRPGIYDSPLFGQSYVDDVAVEAIDHPAPDHVVVTLLATVLHAQGDSYGSAELVRVAVPIAIDGAGARPAGTPWRLRAPDIQLAVPDSGPIDDPTLIPEAVAALEAAGYREVEVVSIEATAGWPFVVTTVATAPGGDTSAQHVIWLRPHGNQFVVAGERHGPPWTAAAKPFPDPSSDPDHQHVHDAGATGDDEEATP